MIGIGRAYTQEFHNVTIAAQQDFFYVKPAADKICIVEAVYIANASGVTLEGDAKEEFWRIEMIRLPATVTVGSGGTSMTPNPLGTNDTAAGFTGRVNDTTVATTNGTAVNLHSDGMNARIPYVWAPPAEHRHLVANAQAWVCRLVTTPTTTTGKFNGTCIVREMP